ncbi:MAG: hypothetical protein FWD60_00275 [Candidatus Azobacteroides sp.]|nr:hypothetical protein [Candidatus Azobacteroides sp.]
MAPLSEWNYCKNTTLNHNLAKENRDCIVRINVIVEEEGGGKCSLFKDEFEVLNLDKIENKLAQREKRNKRKTVDFIFGIEKAREPKNIVLTECKFNYKNVKNLDMTELDEKRKHSSSLLNYELQIFSTFYLLFQDKIYPEAYRKIRRFNTDKRNYEAVTIKKLKDKFFNF